jgi:hypothetical protein
MVGAEGETGNSADRKPPPVTVLRRDGSWAYLDEASAKSHPLYGVEGWAALLGISLGFIGPAIAIFQILQSRATGQEFAIEVALTAVLIGYSLFVAYLLWTEAPKFRMHYTILAGIGLILNLLALVVEPTSAIRDMATAAIWLAYVYLSRRINVTTLKRVRVGDPYLTAEANSG